MASASYSGPLPNNDHTTKITGAPGQLPGHRRTSEEEEIQAQYDNTNFSSSTVHEKGVKGNDDGDDEDDESSGQERRTSLVRDLARTMTRQSTYSAADGASPFDADLESPLNPQGKHFSAMAWAKAVVRHMNDTGRQTRKAGVCYQNLNVFGYGQPTDYQKDIGNVWLDAIALPRTLLGHGKRRIDILRDFDGVVHNGEMLVVLGPPGSGCSTFLKTISGETNGIYVNDDAYFNYQGKFTASEVLPYAHVINHSVV